MIEAVRRKRFQVYLGLLCCEHLHHDARRCRGEENAIAEVSCGDEAVFPQAANQRQMIGSIRSKTSPALDARRVGEG